MWVPLEVKWEVTAGTHVFFLPSQNMVTSNESKHALFMAKNNSKGKESLIFWAILLSFSLTFLAVFHICPLWLFLAHPCLYLAESVRSYMNTRVGFSSIMLWPAEPSSKSVLSSKQLIGVEVGELWLAMGFYRSVGEQNKIKPGNQYCFASISCSLSRSALWSSPWCAALLCWWRWFSQQWIFGARMRMESQKRTVQGTAGKTGFYFIFSFSCDTFPQLMSIGHGYFLLLYFL